jgi:hypothetical protein
MNTRLPYGYISISTAFEDEILAEEHDTEVPVEFLIRLSDETFSGRRFGFGNID